MTNIGGVGTALTILFCGILLNCVFYTSSFDASPDTYNSDALGTMLDGVFKEKTKHTMVPNVEEIDDGESNSPTSGRKHKVLRKVVKVVKTTQEDENDCRSRGGTPCNRDDQCCLGKCSPLGYCPTAQELFDAAAKTVKKEKAKARMAAVEKGNERRRKEQRQQRTY